MRERSMAHRYRATARWWGSSLVAAEVGAGVTAAGAWVVTAPQRLAAFPQVPTMQEAGFRDYDIGSWFGVFAPTGTAPDIVARLAREFAAAVEAADIRERFAAQGAEVLVLPQAEFARFVQTDIARWAAIVKASGARIE